MNDVRPQGYILLISIITILTVGVISAYLSSLAISSVRLAEVRESAPETYYLAEAGINEALWKMNNDPTWKAAFINGTLASSFTRNDMFATGTSYTVSATSTASNPAVAVITSTAKITTPVAVAQRVVTTEVALSTGYTDVWPDAVFAGGKAACKQGDSSGHNRITIPGDPSNYHNLTVEYNGVLYATVPFPTPYPQKKLKWHDNGQISEIEERGNTHSSMVLNIRFDVAPSNFVIKIDGVAVATWNKNTGFSSPYSFDEPGPCKNNSTGKGDIEFDNTNIGIYGDSESNNNIRVFSGAKVTINNGLFGAVHDIIYSGNGTSTLINSTADADIDPRSMPIIDFDSVGSTSLKNRATVVYKPSDFKNYIKTHSSLTGIIYVTGDVDINDTALTINGILAVDGKLNVDNGALYQFKVLPTAGVTGSGIFTYDSMVIKGPFMATGLLFSYKNLTLNANKASQTVTGGLIGWNTYFDGKSTYTITVTYDAQTVANALDPDYVVAPLIKVNHWEEQY